MNTSAEALRQEYEELKKRGFPLGESIDFGAKLGRSPEIALHFELVLEDSKRPISKRWNPENYFGYHHEDGIKFLRRLLTSEDEEAAVGAAYLMAELLIRGRYNDQAKLLCELIETLVRLAGSDAPEHRRKCLIALGWVGTASEIPLLEKHLLNDPDSLCRAWSASSFLQMEGRVPGEELKKTSGALIACLEHEPDVFVRGVAVEAIQDIWKVKFRLRFADVEDRNQKAVDRAVLRALKFLKEES